jgi:cytochrome c oxidase cbb3-type subunit IV
MNAGTWSGVVTGVLLLCFLAGVAWVWSGRRRQEFEEAARLPLEDDQPARAEEPR